MNLSNTQLFRGLEEAEITSLLGCLNATTRSFQKGEVILSEGNITENIGILLSGLAVISCNDIWGNTSILGHVAPGSVFAEVYACIPGEPMLVTVSAAEDTFHIVYECGACPGYLYQCLSIPHKTCPKFADCLRSQKSSAFSKNPAYQFQIHSGAVDVLFFGMRQTRREQFFPDPLQPPTVS